MRTIAPLTLLLALAIGCAAERRPIADAFPPDRAADPWQRVGEVWQGSFEQAAAALGDDVAALAPHAPDRAWLARYDHVSRPDRYLTVRCFSFATPAAAQAAYQALAPASPEPFARGDVDDGCWTEFGVLLRWGQLVIDVFGPGASWDSQVQSSLLAAYLLKRMPPDAPHDPL
jgi:hypothetical protein